MSTVFTNYKQLLVAILVSLICVGTLAGCSSGQSNAVGVEPSLGTPQTLYRDSSPVVSAEGNVLGTVQVPDEPSDDREQALEPIADSSRLPFIWFGVVGLGFVAIAITILALVREDA